MHLPAQIKILGSKLSAQFLLTFLFLQERASSVLKGHIISSHSEYHCYLYHSNSSSDMSFLILKKYRHLLSFPVAQSSKVLKRVHKLQAGKQSHWTL